MYPITATPGTDLAVQPPTAAPLRATDGCLLLMKQAMDVPGLSGRAFDKVRHVARTLADLEGAHGINEGHVAEAVQYRLLDRKF